MKNKISTGLAIFAAMLGIRTTAYAQSSVTLYGDIDIGLQYLTNASRNGKSMIGMQSGNEQPSRFGLTGQEDLGGGYRAIFKLESGFQSGTGNSTVPGTLFDRYAYVGIQQDNVGTITVGQQRSLLFEQSLFYDPTFLAQYSAASTNYIPVSTFNQNNSFKWVSPVFSGLTISGMYGFGQQLADNTSAGRFISAALSFERPHYGAHVVFEQSRGELSAGSDLSGKVDRRVSFAARYQFDALTGYAGYTNISGDLQLSPPGQSYYAGATYQVSPALLTIAEVAHYHTKNDSGQPTWFIVGADYFLSKQVSVYAYGGIYKNHGASSFKLNTYDFTSPGGLDQTGILIGMNYLF